MLLNEIILFNISFSIFCGIFVFNFQRFDNIYCLSYHENNCDWIEFSLKIHTIYVYFTDIVLHLVWPEITYKPQHAYSKNHIFEKALLLYFIKFICQYDRIYIQTKLNFAFNLTNEIFKIIFWLNLKIVIIMFYTLNVYNWIMI